MGLVKGIYENTHFVSDCINKYGNFQKSLFYSIYRVNFFYLTIRPNLEFLFLKKHQNWYLICFTASASASVSFSLVCLFSQRLKHRSVVSRCSLLFEDWSSFSTHLKSLIAEVIFIVIMVIYLQQRYNKNLLCETHKNK